MRSIRREIVALYSVRVRTIASQNRQQSTFFLCFAQVSLTATAQRRGILERQKEVRHFGPGLLVCYGIRPSRREKYPAIGCKEMYQRPADKILTKVFGTQAMRALSVTDLD